MKKPTWSWHEEVLWLTWSKIDLGDFCRCWFTIKRNSDRNPWRTVVMVLPLMPSVTSWIGRSIIVLSLLAFWTWRKCWSKNLVQHGWARSACQYGSAFGDGYFAAHNSYYRSVCLSKSHSKIGIVVVNQLCAVLQSLGCQEPWENNVMWGSSAEWSSFW